MSFGGWLTPKREFIEAPLYRHMGLISSDERMQPEKVKSLLTYLKEIEKECNEIAEKDGNHNAEWHIYEIAMDNAAYKIWNILMDEGYMRISNKDDIIYFEGKSWVIKKNFDYCKEWALSFNCKAVFEVAGNKRV